MVEIAQFNLANDLLASSTIIKRKYELIAKTSGEQFNIFNILDVSTNEVRLHSAFIAELLNPNGSHGQDAVFLDLFIKNMEIPFFEDIVLNKCNIQVEYYIDRLNNDLTKGGRIDILISSDCGKHIVIENKIHASDQLNQLLRYKNAFPEAAIIYLNLDGSPPSAESKAGLADEEFLIRSYELNILSWLKACLGKAVNIPMLRECLNQYINLVKSLTGQTLNQNQNMEIKSLIMESEEKFRSAELISAGLNDIKRIIETCEKDALNAWVAKFGTKEVELFNYFNYSFRVKISNEYRYLHFDFFALKNGALDCANDEPCQPFRIIAKQFENRPINKDNFFENVNYLVWVWSKHDLRQRELKYEKIKELMTDNSTWINDVINEGINFINHILRYVKMMDDKNIQIKMRELN